MNQGIELLASLEIFELLLNGRPSSKGREISDAASEYGNLGVVKLAIKRADGEFEAVEELSSGRWKEI